MIVPVSLLIRGHQKNNSSCEKSDTVFLQFFIWGNKLLVLLLHGSPKLRHIFWRILRFLDINLHPSFKLTRGYCCWEWKETSLWAFFVDFYFLQTSQLYKSFKAVSLNKITFFLFYDFIEYGQLWQTKWCIFALHGFQTPFHHTNLTSGVRYPGFLIEWIFYWIELNWAK